MINTYTLLSISDVELGEIYILSTIPATSVTIFIFRYYLPVYCLLTVCYNPTRARHCTRAHVHGAMLVSKTSGLSISISQLVITCNDC